MISNYATIADYSGSSSSAFHMTTPPYKKMETCCHVGIQSFCGNLDNGEIYSYDAFSMTCVELDKIPLPNTYLQDIYLVLPMTFCIPRWQLNRVYMKLWSHHDFRVPSTVPLFNILEELCDQRGILAGSCADPSPTHCIHQSTVLQWKWENGTHTTIVWPAHSK